MKKTVFIAILFLSVISVQAQKLNTYYFGNASFDPKITHPTEFFGFEIGESLVRYDKVVEYFKLLAEESERIEIETYGFSYQNREQVKLIISTENNIKNLESIKHNRKIDAFDKGDKLIFEFAYNVHGGEISGTDASVLTAYFFAAIKDPSFLQRLENTIVLIDPAQNPDGRERAAHHINSFHAGIPVSDPADLGHGSSLTPHRGNHFWNDLNRDWLPLSQVESRNKVAYYHTWYPHVYLDFHEMGSSSSYYFEPSPLSSWNKQIPQENYTVLTERLAQYFGKSLDSIGSFYFTKESFTNLSPIYGSTYPDYQGGVGITLEVGGTSGVSLETPFGIRTFAKNLRDNFVVGIAGFKAATDDPGLFINYQKAFFDSALKEADKLPYQAIYFGSQKDHGLNALFIEHLLAHKIEVYKSRNSEYPYVVPLKQSQFRILQSIFEENETNGFDGSQTFYDVSGWSTAHGFGVPFKKNKLSNLGNLITSIEDLQNQDFSVNVSQLAYAFTWDDFNAPQLLYDLQNQGVLTQVAQKPFTTVISQKQVEFDAGTILIPVGLQRLPSEEIYNVLKKASSTHKIPVFSLEKGYSVAGIDLGSNSIKVIDKPKIALLTGGNWTQFGEVWSLLSEIHKIPVTKITPEQAQRVNLSDYSSLIVWNLPQGNLKEKVENFVVNGGSLMVIGNTNAHVFNKPDNSNSNEISKTQRIPGVIFPASIDTLSVLSFGLKNTALYSLNNQLEGLDIPDSFKPIIHYNPHKPLNGYLDKEFLKNAEEKLQVQSAYGTLGRGNIILLSDSPFFRGYYYANSKVLTNALFFRQLLNTSFRF